MDPTLLAKLGQVALSAIGSTLVTKGILTAAQESLAETTVVSTVGGLCFLGSLGWNIYRHYRPTAATVAHVNAQADAGKVSP